MIDKVKTALLEGNLGVREVGTGVLDCTIPCTYKFWVKGSEGLPAISIYQRNKFIVRLILEPQEFIELRAWVLLCEQAQSRDYQTAHMLDDERVPQVKP